MLALLLSGIGGIMGGYIMYFIKKGNYNPVIGIAAVSCVPTTAKVAQKLVSKDNPNSFILGDALGANISGVITSAIITGILYNDYTLFINHRAGDKIILGMTIENHSVVIGNPERLKSIVIHVFLVTLFSDS